jgi:hypothetical protein
MFVSDGPGYLLDGYFARPMPDGSVGVVDVVQLGGRIWVQGSPGL